VPCHHLPSLGRTLVQWVRLVALFPTKMVGELATFWAVVSSTVESVLWHSPSNTAHVEVVGELAAKFQKVEGRHTKLERSAA
jgi:hypothetical protein